MARIPIFILIFCLFLGFSGAGIVHKFAGGLEKTFRKKEICMGKLGCFDIPPEFYHPIYRPINFLPEDNTFINTTFQLFTLSNPSKGQFIVADNDRTLQNSFFDQTLDTKFIIHGYLDRELFGTWMQDMKDQFLLRGAYNIIIVDWTQGNKLPYAQAAANARVVGAEIAYLVKYLQKHFSMSMKQFHIIGHSLGAQAAGYAGKKLDKVSRITGMDPAEPYFQNMPPTVRIDKTDAQFVDIIHTDSKSILLLGLGMSQAVGHFDFYPNNGRDNPGCEKTTSLVTIVLEGLIQGIRDFVACDHMRAVDFFTASLNDHACAFVAYPCPDWETYTDGHCTSCGAKGEKCAILGMDSELSRPYATNESRKFFIKTGDSSSFCLFHYSVSIKLTRLTGLKDEEGTMKIKIQGQKGDFTPDLGGKKYLYSGATYRFLVTTAADIGDIETISFSWSSSGYFTWFKRIYVETITVQTLSIADPDLRQKSARTLCNQPNTGIAPSSNVIFKPKDKC